MGCASSKIENEETVRLCKIRKRYIKEAVGHRNRFAAAHASYVASLKDTGSALRQFGEAEVHLNDQAVAPVPVFSSFFQPLPPPPLPPPEKQAPAPSLPLPRAVSMPPLVMRSAAASPSRSSRPSTLNEEEEDPAYLAEDSRHSARSSSAKPLDEIGSHIFDTRVSSSVMSDMDDVDYETYGSKAPDSDNDEVLGHREEELPERMPSANVKKGSSVPATPENESRKQPQTPSTQRAATGGKDLAAILKGIDENFLTSYEAGKRVSRMLEAHRMHYHTPYTNEKSGMKEHHEKVLNILTLGKALESQPSTANGGIVKVDNNNSLASTLDKLHAWEKKLYDEVKAGEATRIELEKKSAQLKSQKERGVPQSKVDQTKASVKTLQTRYLVEFQAVDSATQEVQELRDKYLYPQLLELLDGLKEMWKNMFACHEVQFLLVTELMSLKISSTGSGTSEFQRKIHLQITRDLEKEITFMHERLQEMVTTQEDWINALYEWLSRNISPVESELKDSPLSSQKLAFPPIYNLCKSWVDVLKKISCESALNQLNNFSRILKEMMIKQGDEIKLKTRAEGIAKDLEKKKKVLEVVEAKYNEKVSKMRVPQENIELISRSPVTESRNIIDLLQKNLEEEEESFAKLCMENSGKILASLKEGLPPVIESMLKFSRSCMDAYEDLHRQVSRGEKSAS